MQLRIFTICICTFLALSVFTFTSFSAGIEIIKLHERLAGTWANDFFEATFDWKNGIYSGKVFDKNFSQPLILIKEYDNIVIFTTEKNDKSGIKVEIINNNQISMLDQSSVNKIPIILKRKK
jgi:hypothetical protein